MVCTFNVRRVLVFDTPLLRRSLGGARLLAKFIFGNTHLIFT